MTTSTVTARRKGDPQHYVEGKTYINAHIYIYMYICIYTYICIYRYVYCRGLTASAAEPRSKIRCHEFKITGNVTCELSSWKRSWGLGASGSGGGLGDSGPLTWWLGGLGGLGGGSGALAGLRGPGGLGAQGAKGGGRARAARRSQKQRRAATTRPRMV